MPLHLIALEGLPRIRAGDDLATLTASALQRMGLTLRDGDVLVYAQKVVSKAEGRLIDLKDIEPSARAIELAAQALKDPRLMELILRESRRVVRVAANVIIVEHRLGYIMANAGIDQSNVADPAQGSFALLLPEAPDRSAERLRAELERTSRCRLGIIISDSFGRPWRVGTVGVAIGCAGVAATRDLRGTCDLYGRELRVTVVGHADEIAAAASLLMGQADEGCPIVLVSGLSAQEPAQPASALLRPSAEDLFR
jgi:coenzyme F420-0:L-glutamate ligase / coenzyme F420-1:gamma-L-glutamate ligase